MIHVLYSNFRNQVADFEIVPNCLKTRFFPIKRNCLISDNHILTTLHMSYK